MNDGLIVIYILAQKRKHAAANAGVAVNGPSPFHVSSVAAVASQKNSSVADKDDGSSDEDMFDTDAQWYWRDDKRYDVDMLCVWWVSAQYCCLKKKKCAIQKFSYFLQWLKQKA